jgi:hypothetical protein
MKNLSNSPSPSYDWFSFPSKIVGSTIGGSNTFGGKQIWRSIIVGVQTIGGITNYCRLNLFW